MRQSGFPKLTILMVRECLRSGRFLKTKPETGILSQVLGMGKLYEKAVTDFHGISQARILEWVAISFPGDLFDPGIQPTSPALQVDSLLLSQQGGPSNA